MSSSCYLNTGVLKLTTNSIVDDFSPPSDPWLVQLGAVTVGPGGSNSSADICNAVAVDNRGNVYCAGYTGSSMGEAKRGVDAFVLKLDANGTLQWITQLGAVTMAPGGDNLGTDFCRGIAIDSLGNVYCAGGTNGSVGEANGGDVDALVMKLNADGELQWVTQLGAVTKAPSGSNAGYEQCFGLAIDSSDNLYCTGYTTGALGEASGGSGDVFVLKMNSNGVLQWVTQLGAVTKAPGGSNAGNDQCIRVSVDRWNNVYCTGITSGSMGELNGGSMDTFVLKLNSNGVLQWVTQLGAVTKAPSGSNAGTDSCLNIANDSSGNVYCGGYTNGPMGEAIGGNRDTFIMKLNTNGALQWLTHLGAVTKAPGGSNAGDDLCGGVSVDSSGNVICAGATTGAMSEPNGGSYDVFVLKLSSTGSLEWVTQFGANTIAPGGDNAGDNECVDVTFDRWGNIYCAGATTGNMAEANGGSYDALILKLPPTGQFQ